MNIKLRIIGGKHAGKEVEVRAGQFLIGRGEQCHMRPASEMVSRCHCAIISQNNQVYIRDFASSNGTLVNGQRIEGETFLRNGDRIQVGPLEFLIAIGYSGQSAVVDPSHIFSPVSTSGPPCADDQIQQWLGSPAQGDVHDTVESVSDTQLNANEQNNSVPVVSRIRKEQLIRAKPSPKKLPKQQEIALPDPSSYDSSQQAANAAIASLVASNSRKNT